MKSAWMFCVVAMVFGGCGRECDKPTSPPASSKQQTVTLYTAIDTDFAKQIVERFEKVSGIKVQLRTDGGEARKTAGLSARLLAEKDNPQADVWWSNEIFHTVNLADAGAFAAYDSPAAGDIPARYRDAKHLWTATGLRQRVIAITQNEEGAAARDVRKLGDLLDPKLKGKISMAPPAVGTVGGQVAAIYWLWGDEKADAYFKALKSNGVRIATGNGHVARLTGEGTIWAGMTDNDDVTNAQSAGGKLVDVPADLDGRGALMVPTSIGLVAGAKHPETAKKLIDFLLSQEVEKVLIEGKFFTSSVRNPLPTTALEIDYAAAARLMPRAIERASAILE